ncbi:MAG: PQQ-binding-like beta-propeller repeat protein [Verrucomicrobiota bacterium]
MLNAFRMLLKNHGFAAGAALTITLGFGSSANAQDWTQWRGPTRDGIVPASSATTSWPESFDRVWRVEVGEGYSSPVVSNGRVFAHSRRDSDELVTAIGRTNGRVIWQQTYPAPFQKNQSAVRMAKGPNSTPLVLGDRLFTLGGSAILTAWDTATGRQLWRKDLSGTVDTSKLFCGTSASPLAVAGLLVVQVGSDVHGGQIIGVDPATGGAKWEWRGLGPGYASPIVVDVAGKAQIVTLTERSIIGLDAQSGVELWTTPFPDEWQENIVTPLWTGSHLIVSGTRQGTHAYALQPTNGQWGATEVWKNPGVAMYMSSPVYGDGLIYGHSRKERGQFVALDAKTGAIRWASDGRDGDYASVLLTPRSIVYLTNGGDLIIARRSTATFQVERRYRAADAGTWSIPVLVGADVLVRDATSLIQLRARPISGSVQ